jgi:hypothetical protein
MLVEKVAKLKISLPPLKRSALPISLVRESKVLASQSVKFTKLAGEGVTGSAFCLFPANSNALE